MKRSEMTAAEKRRNDDLQKMREGQPFGSGVLEDKIRDLLARLSVFTEAPAGNLEAQIARSAPESSPPGDSLRVVDNDSHRDRSLYDWYLAQFIRHAGNPDRLLSLYLAGEREYLRRTEPELHKRTAEKGSIVAYSQEGYVVEGMAAEQVVEEFEGIHALDVAIIIGKTEAWVLKVRRQHGRRPEDGRPRPDWHAWDEDLRRVKCALAAEEGLSMEAAANRFGVHRETVKKYWPGSAAPATVAA